MKQPGARDIELSIERMAAGGDGVGFAEIDGARRAIFVPRVAPGERVLARVDASSSPARGEVIALRTAAAQRREPPCPSAERCGGCPWMFLDAEGQRQARSALAAEVLAKSGAALPALVYHPAPAAEGYRGRARLAVVGRGKVSVGYREARTHRVLDVRSCLVLDPRLSALLPALGGWLAGAKGEGEARVATGAKGLAVVELDWRGELPSRVFGALAGAVEAGALGGASLRLDGAREPALIGDASVWVEGPDGAPLLAPSFAQANAAVAAQIAGHLRGMVGEGRAHVVELFAGAATFSVALAPGQKGYTAVEGDAASCKAARANLERRGLAWVKVIEADAERFAVPAGASVVVLDPPRTGAPGACAALAASKVRELIYVSCDPATLARDLAALTAGGFAVASLDVFDMFPNTSHCEVVARLWRG